MTSRGTTRLRRSSGLRGERLVLDLAAAPGADIDVSACQFFQGRLPGSQTVDVDARFIGIGAMEQCMRLLQRIVLCTGIQPIMADLLETLGQDMLDEAPKEFYRLQRDDFSILGSKRHVALVYGDQPTVGDGDTMGIAPQILQYVFRVAKRLFDIDYPAVMFFQLLHQPLETSVGFWQLSGSM